VRRRVLCKAAGPKQRESLRAHRARQPDEAADYSPAGIVRRAVRAAPVGTEHIQDENGRGPMASDSRGEVLGLRLADIDLIAGTVTVRRNRVELLENNCAAFDAEPKTDAGKRTVVIPPHLMPVLGRVPWIMGRGRVARC